MMEKNSTRVYDIKMSVVDSEKKCIRVPVNMPGENMCWIDKDLPILIDVEIRIFYSKLNFTGKWHTKSDEKDIKEYIFFYE